MLTPEQIMGYRKQYGLQPLSTPTPASSMGDEENKQQEPGYLSRVGSSYMKRAKNIISDVKRPRELAGQGASPFKVGGAILESGLRAAGNVAGGAFDPITTALEPVLKPVIEKLSSIPGVQGGVQRISEWAKAHPEAAKDFGAVFDIATLGAGKAGEPIAKGVLEMGAKGAAGTLETAGRAGKVLGEKAYGLTVPMEEATSKALLSSQAKEGTLLTRMTNSLKGETAGRPVTEANTAARMGLMGTEREIGVQAKRFQNKIWEGLEPQLKGAKDITDMRQFVGELRNEITKGTPELGRRNALLEGLEAFAEDYKKVGKIGGEKLQDYKEGWAQFIPEATYKGKPIGSAIKEVKNLAASKARKLLYDKLGPEARQAYEDYGNLQSIVKSAVKSSTGDAAKKSFSRNIWEEVMDRVITPISTVGGKILYKTGEGLEFIGNKGARKVGDIIGRSDNLLDAAANTTKDLPMGMSIKNISKLTDDEVIDSLRSTKLTDFSKSGKLNVDAIDELDALIKKANESGAPLSQQEINQGRELLRLSEGPKKAPGVAATPETAMTQEARKYKSAEEFVSKQPTYYHGGNLEGGIKPGLSLTKEPSVAEGYVFKRDIQGAKVNEFYLSKEPKTISYEYWRDTINSENFTSSEAIEYFRKQGVDGVVSDKNLRVINPDILQTKSQLTDIWNKANKK